MSRLNDQFGRGLANFDPAGDAGFKTVGRVAGGIGCFVIGKMLFGLMLTGAVIYVIVHFLAKAW